MKPEAFNTIIEHLKWELRLHGFISSAASLFYDIIMDHPLVDGNKRSAVLMLNAYLFRNGYSLRGIEELYELAIKVAEKKIGKNRCIGMAKEKSRGKKMTWEEAIREAAEKTYPILVKLREYDLKHERC